MIDRKKHHVLAFLASTALVVALSSSSVLADPPMPPPRPPMPPSAPAPGSDDPIGERVFPPELIMSHQAEIGLDDKTRAAIVDEIQKFQTSIIKLEWDLRAASEQLGKVLDGPVVDENKALAQADKVMALEHDLKKAHLTLLVRLKNKLTAEQQAKLKSLRPSR